MAEPYRFELECVGNIDEGNNGFDEENDGAERLLNLNWCLCGRCEVWETARECVCCVEEESENKPEGTLLSSIYQDATSSCSIFYFCFVFVILAEY